MPQAGGMDQLTPTTYQNRCIGITGASGTLGCALTRSFRARGAEVVGLTHSSPPQIKDDEGPHRWISWQCGDEIALDGDLAQFDVLVLNHGINPKGGQSPEDVNRALEINALSSWRLMQRYEEISRCNVRKHQGRETPMEIWINTSEAEIQPAVSPVYEISKRLLGQLVSLRGATRPADERNQLVIRKLVLGPFRSDLNPIGIMDANWVANQVLNQASWGLRLIIVTPNPLTYLLMPVTELGRRTYSRILSRPDQ
jgi:nucleoside-diphosphate-sugar epimerase